MRSTTLLPSVLALALASSARAQGEIEAFGTGCHLVGNPPVLEGLGTANLGSVLTLRTHSIATSGPAALVLGLRRDRDVFGPLPRQLDPFRMPGCIQWIAFDLPFPLPVNGGTTLFATPLPTDPALFGGELFFQHLHLDPAANLLGWSFSNALRVRVGRVPYRLRVMSYNIHHGEGLDGRLDLDRIARILRSWTPDVVALQEVDRHVPRSGSVDQAIELARLTGWTAVFGRSIPLNGGEYGNAWLVRWPHEDVQVVPLPNPQNREPRTLLSLRCFLPEGRRLRCYGTHLDHVTDPTNRIAQVDAIVARARTEVDPIILAGDLNDLPGGTVLSRLGAVFQDGARFDPAPTFRADQPTRRIDYVLSSEPWTPLATRVPVEPLASDHRPVWVDFDMP